MAEAKNDSKTEKRDNKSTFYYPDTIDGKGGSVRAIDREAADKLAIEQGLIPEPPKEEASDKDAGKDQAN